MADVYAVFGTLLALGIVFPGMLMAWKILFPGVAERAETRLARTPGRTFGMGLIGVVLVAIPAVILSALPFGPAKFLGAVTILTSLAVASLGASGLAAIMGRRIQDLAQRGDGGPREFLQGAVALELAAAFPIIGWFLFIPLTIVVCFGAAIFALLGWVPSGAPEEPVKQAIVDPQIRHEPQSA